MIPVFRKNFVGNQPNILYNSAFQSLVAAMNSYHVRKNGGSVTRMTAEELRAEVFTGEDLSQFDGELQNRSHLQVANYDNQVTCVVT